MDQHTPSSDPTAAAKKQMAALEAWLAPLFAKAPHIPKNGRDVLVQIAPWLALVFGVLGILASISAFGVTTWLPFGYGANGLVLTVALLISFIASVLEIMAWKPLTETKKKGWNYLFYSTVLSAMSALLYMFFSTYGSLGSVLGVLIGFWLLFEVRSHYHA